MAQGVVQPETWQPSGAPRSVALSLDPAGTSSALQVAYAPPAASGGLPIATYRIEWSPSPDFSSGVGRLDVPCAAAAHERHAGGVDGAARHDAVVRGGQQLEVGAR